MWLALQTKVEAMSPLALAALGTVLGLASGVAIILIVEKIAKWLN